MPALPRSRRLGKLRKRTFWTHPPPLFVGPADGQGADDAIGFDIRQILINQGPAPAQIFQGLFDRYVGQFDGDFTRDAVARNNIHFCLLGDLPQDVPDGGVADIDGYPVAMHPDALFLRPQAPFFRGKGW